MLPNGDVADHLLHLDSTVCHNACFGYPTNDDDLNPHQKFQFQDDFKIMKKTATVETYKEECSKLRKDCLTAKCHSIYSKMRYDRKYQCVQLALKLMNKTSNYYYYTAPVQNRSASHWYVVQVLFPQPQSVISDDRKANGMTSLTDFCAQPITNVSPEYYATMWYAIFLVCF